MDVPNKHSSVVDGETSLPRVEIRFNSVEVKWPARNSAPDDGRFESCLD
ncbi:hypothetical protein BN79_067 [Yersinia phage phiR2-01]|uniref:Uncharacterized protein n=1 Tax=Yersinia phage phiR2-01 TaxID=1206557 RepID=I7LGZ6_9CAUD|nr:hypothetical protein BN79_067 [Yersinia phage phiR2-01]CCI88484.1 hypothetical protein BN79_067 [Yersinia phage phiR2-01]